jgi:hypothetical protein
LWAKRLPAAGFLRSFASMATLFVQFNQTDSRSGGWFTTTALGKLAHEMSDRHRLA